MTVLVKKDDCGWVFKVKRISPQNKEKKASDKASDVTIRRCPGSRVQPGRETRWRPAVRTSGGAQEECVFLVSIRPPHTHTHTLASLFHIQVCQLIYLHGLFQVWKFGQVTTSTKRTSMSSLAWMFVLCCLFYFLHLMSQFLLKQRDKVSHFQDLKKPTRHPGMWPFEPLIKL